MLTDGEDDDNGGVDLRRLLAAYTHHHAGRRLAPRYLDLQVPPGAGSVRLPCDFRLTPRFIHSNYSFRDRAWQSSTSLGS